jgi:hypothetical protein
MTAASNMDMHLALRCAILSLALSWAAGATTIVTLQHNGASVAEGEVCLFRAADAENPFRRWLSSGEVTCVAPGWPMDFPSGLWNVFGRIEGKALSAPVLIDSTAAPPTLVLQLETAATLLPMLPAGQRGLVVVPRRNSAIPVVAGAQRVTVPAGQELWLLTMEKSREKSRAISGLFPIPAIEPGSERPVDARAGGLRASVLGWVQVPPADRAALSQAPGVSSPRVRLIAAGPALDSDPLPPPAWLSGSFVLVRGVSAGEAELRAEGHGWLPHGRRLTIGDRPITVVDDPVLARGASSLNVSWTGEGLAGLDASLGACTSVGVAPLVVITVSACPRPQPGESIDPTTCKEIRRETFVPQVPFGSFAVDDVAPGHYLAELSFGKLPPIGSMEEVEPFELQRLLVQAYYSTFSGSLTHGGEPLGKDAKLKVEGGGVGFASQETGQYHAVIPDPYGSGLGADAKIDIVTCDEDLRVFVLTDRPLGSNAHYDIDIPDNSITVRVTDTFTGMSLLSATLRYVVMSDDRPRRPVVTKDLKSEGDPEFVIKAVPERRQIALTVRHPGYQEHSIERFAIGKSEHKTFDVHLVPLRGSSGRIVSALPFESGVVLWMSPAGTETERAEVAPDGTFVYQSAHPPDETMAVVSLSHPLWVLRAPAVATKQGLVVQFPDTAPRRAFRVLLRGPDRRTGTFVGVVIGGLLVPHAALKLHQTLRELPYVVSTDRLLNLRDIADTGPIDVLLGPTVNEVPSRGRSFDPLLLPRTGEVPRQRLAPGMTEVVFEQ